MREFQQWSQNGSKSGQRNQNHDNLSGSVTALPEELPNGSVKVGKITFDPTQLLGKGCEGTFVYKLVNLMSVIFVLSISYLIVIGANSTREKLPLNVCCPSVLTLQTARWPCCGKVTLTPT